MLVAAFAATTALAGRGFLTGKDNTFVWENGEAFVPNYVMLGTNDGPLLNKWSKAEFDAFLDDLMGDCGFTGVHIPVYGQWFKIGERKPSGRTEIDQRTFDVLKWMIQKVYARGGAVHIWMWGDKSRGWSSKDAGGGMMGAGEKNVLDAILDQLNDIPGWTIGYGFDLWEWVDNLDRWYGYMQSRGMKHLMGGRGSKNNYRLPGSKFTYAGWEWHKPDYNDYVQHITKANNLTKGIPSISEDRFRIRGRSKDATPDQTRDMLWWATLAGGVGGIWGYLGSESGTSRKYPNADELKTYSTFWFEKERFTAGLQRANDLVDGGYAMRDANASAVYFKESAGSVKFKIEGGAKKVIAVDAKDAYKEIEVATLGEGWHTWDAPRQSTWALAAESPETVGVSRHGNADTEGFPIAGDYSLRTRTLTLFPKHAGTVSLQTVDGRVMWTRAVQASQRYQWDLASLPPAMYLFQVTTPEQTKSHLIGTCAPAR